MATPHDDLPPEAHQFDFWLGEWELTWDETNHATNTIRAALDGRVIEEHFEGAPASPLRGMSVSVYDAAQQCWRQTWVDNNGSYMSFTGGMEQSDMVLRMTTLSDGQPKLWRMVFTNITANQLDWHWQSSTDDGATWTMVWNLHYTRKV